MYSVVLMMAMTGGADMPAGLFNHGCCGGGGHHGGSSSCYGGSCYGGSKHGHHGGCMGSCYGASCYGGSCYGSGYGCSGGKHHGGRMHHQKSCGCCGGSYAGCYGGNYGGCYGGNYSGNYGGCYGGMGIGAPVMQGVPSTTTPVNPGKKTSIDGTAPATLVINLPADAKLTIDDEATTATSTERVFVSPALEIGREFHYTLKAQFVKEGKPVTVSKEVAVIAGQETRVRLDAESVDGVASR